MEVDEECMEKCRRRNQRRGVYGEVQEEEPKKRSVCRRAPLPIQHAQSFISSLEQILLFNLITSNPHPSLLSQVVSLFSSAIVFILSVEQF